MSFKVVFSQTPLEAAAWPLASEKIFGGPMGLLVAVQVIFQRESEFADFAFVRSSVSLLVAAKWDALAALEE